MQTIFYLSEIDTTLTQLRLRTVVNMVRRPMLSGSLAEVEVSPGEALLVWLAALLAARQPVAQKQQDLILTWFAEKVQEIGNRLAEEYDSKTQMTMAQLLLLDNTLVGLSGTEDWLDLRTGEVVKSRRMPIEMVSYNLTALYSFHRERLTRKAEGPCPNSPTTPSPQD